jgi:hypothetical protein
MTPLLLAPLGLAALAALIVPLVIHLRRRTEEVPVDFAALRWLDPRPRPRSKLRFDEWLLLAFRLLLLTLLALLLARPAVLGWEDDSPRIIVAPGVDPAAARKLAEPDADIRWIAPDFPAIDSAPPESRIPVSSLIRQFDAELPADTALTILVPPVLDGVDGGRLRLTRKVTWRIVDGARQTAGPVPPVSPALAVRYAEGQADAVRYFRAAAAAWSETPRFDASADTGLPPRSSVLVWLIPGPLPQPVTDWIGAGGTALLGNSVEIAMPAATEPLWRDEGGGTLVEGGVLGAGRVLRFARPLAPAQMPALLSPDFAATLRDVVSPPAPPPARVSASAFAPTSGAAPYELPPRDLAPWLAVLIALVFLAERWLASRPRRFAA